VPSGVISKEKMQEVLWDVLRAEALSQEIIKKDSSKSSAVESAMLTKKIFSIHHITEEEFKKSYSYYSAHPDIMKEILDSITAKQIRKGSVDTLL
jgi:CRISPR/Cas system CSM-associated protein Csm2 small subunit